MVKMLPTVTKIWEDVRKPRFERVREYCRDFRTVRPSKPKGGEGDELRHPENSSSAQDLKDKKSGIDADFASEEFRKWLFDHDVLEGLDKLWQQRAGFKAQGSVVN